ncbi:cyclin-O-like [Pterocles gutturalis]
MSPPAGRRGQRGEDGAGPAPPLKSKSARPQGSRHRSRSPLSSTTVTAESGRRSRTPHRRGPGGSPGSCPRPPARQRTRAAVLPWESRQELRNFREYGESWYQSCKEVESRYHPREPLARQTQVTSEARCKLVSWIIPVYRQLGFSFETLCLTVNILDRFLTTTAVSADCFQLLGLTALLIASKQAEVRPRRVREILAFCGGIFTRQHLLSMERIVLQRLGFALEAPTINFFVDHFSRVRLEGRGVDAREVADARILAVGVAEISLADYAFTKYTPSLLAASCLGLADWLLGHRQPLNLWISGYPKALLQGCMVQLQLLVSLNRHALPLLLPPEVARKCPLLWGGR